MPKHFLKSKLVDPNDKTKGYKWKLLQKGKKGAKDIEIAKGVSLTKPNEGFLDRMGTKFAEAEIFVEPKAAKTPEKKRSVQVEQD